jgi:hypothetical protein
MVHQARVRPPTGSDGSYCYTIVTQNRRSRHASVYAFVGILNPERSTAVPNRASRPLTRQLQQPC